MIDVLFRGKRLNGDGWVCGDLSHHVHSGGEVYVFPGDGYDSPDCYEVDPHTVGRCSFLTDRDGTLIFEGDVVSVEDCSGLKYIFEVKFGACGGVKNVQHDIGYIGFYFSLISDSRWERESIRTDPLYFLGDLGTQVKIIGNIYDNPDSFISGVGI